MNKNQQVLLGVAVVGVAGYLYMKSKKPKAAAFTKVGMAGDKSGFLAGKVAPAGSQGAFKKDPKAGFLAGNVQQAGSDGFGQKAGFLAGNVQQTGSNGFGTKSFAKVGFAVQGQPSSGPFLKAEGSAAGDTRNVPTENVTTNSVINPFFKVKGAHVGTPTLWK